VKEGREEKKEAAAASQRIKTGSTGIKPVQPVLLQCEQLKHAEKDADYAEFLPD
jgi:hypothetical protein